MDINIIGPLDFNRRHVLRQHFPHRQREKNIHQRLVSRFYRRRKIKTGQYILFRITLPHISSHSSPTRLPIRVQNRELFKGGICRVIFYNRTQCVIRRNYFPYKNKLLFFHKAKITIFAHKFIIKMKKIKLFLLIFISVLFFSCKDESGEFAYPILSDADMVQGIKDCLNKSLDTANAHLAVTNGFYQYNENAYRINFPASAERIIDTLIEHGHMEMIDNLIISMNRMAESNGSNYKTQFSSVINKTSFPDPKSIIGGANNAACEYFKSVQLLPLIDLLKPILEKSMEELGVNGQWKEILLTYALYDASPVILDFPYDVTRQITENLMAEMTVEERLIRRYESHRVTDLLKSIFNKK